MEKQTFREIAGTYPTGVTVITGTNAEGRPVGMTANSFTTLSLSPLLVMFAIDKSASLFSDFMESPSFAVNILASQQEHVSRQFSKKNVDRFEGVAYKKSDMTGCPILENAASYFDCRIVDRHEAGDHVIVIGEVLDGARFDQTPLIFCQGRYL